MKKMGATYMPKGKISGKIVNFRDKAGMNGAILGTLNSGTPLEILEESGEWIKVAVTGYVSKKLVAKDKTPASPPKPPWIDSSLPPVTDPVPQPPPVIVNNTKFLWQNVDCRRFHWSPPRC